VKSEPISIRRNFTPEVNKFVRLACRMYPSYLAKEVYYSQGMVATFYR